MNITNRSGLPDILVRAIKNDSYSKGDSDFSVTELLKPAKLSALEKEHHSEIEEDAEDRLYSLYGQLSHLLIERAQQGEIAEKRFKMRFGTHIISAQVDSLSLHDGVLTDWKFTTAWKFKNGKAADDNWTAQLNMQLEILRQNGLDAKKIQIVGLIRDFSKPESRRNESYPQSPVVTVDIEMWDRGRVSKFISSRLYEHTVAPLTRDCTKDERWATDDMWALMKKGQKRAVKLFLSKDEALAVAATDPALFVEPRPGESKRCEMYCKVSKFCKQFQKLKE